MEEINKEDIEQLKRDLYTYGYYTKKIEESQSKLYELGLQLKDREQAQGINYDERMRNSDPYHPTTAALIYEEETMQIELRKLKEKRDKLNLNDICNYLTEEEHQVISSHFFDKLSYSYISVNMSYTYEEKAKQIAFKSIRKILKKMKKCPTGH